MPSHLYPILVGVSLLILTGALGVHQGIKVFGLAVGREAEKPETEVSAKPRRLRTIITVFVAAVGMILILVGVLQALLGTAREFRSAWKDEFSTTRPAEQSPGELIFDEAFEADEDGKNDRAIELYDLATTVGLEPGREKLARMEIAFLEVFETRENSDAPENPLRCEVAQSQFLAAGLLAPGEHEELLDDLRSSISNSECASRET